MPSSASTRSSTWAASAPLTATSRPSLHIFSSWVVSQLHMLGIPGLMPASYTIVGTGSTVL